MKELKLKQFEKLMNEEYEVVDFRSPQEFVEGFIPNSFYIDPTNENALIIFNQFASPFKNLLAILPKDESNNRDNILENVDELGIHGYLKGGYDAWKAADKPHSMLIAIEPDEFEMDIKHDEDIVVIDVRDADAFEKIHLENSSNAPLQQIPILISELQQNEKLYVLSDSFSNSLSVTAYFNRHGLSLSRTLKGSITDFKKSELEMVVKKDKKKSPKKSK